MERIGLLMIIYTYNKIYLKEEKNNMNKMIEEEGN